MTTKRPTRARITERDSLYLGFLAKFPAADAEGLSYLAVKAQNPFGIEAGELTEPSGIDKRMAKLVKMGAATKFRNPISGVNHYGVTAMGNEAAKFYNYDCLNWKGIEGLSISRLEHYRNIALIAAQFLSPSNHFAKVFGLHAVKFEQVICENEMRLAYENINYLLKKQRELGEGSSDFGTYRKELRTKIDDEIERGIIDYDTVVTSYPQLLTLGNEKNLNANLKPILQPDLAIVLDHGRRTATSPKAKNLLIEVELSLKVQADYEKILLTIEREIKEGAAYGRAIYFVGNTTIASAVKRADKSSGADLIAKKLLMILPIEGRKGTKYNNVNRVVVPKGKPATVEFDDDDALPDLDLF